MKILFIITVFVFLTVCFLLYKIVVKPIRNNKTVSKKSSTVSSDLDALLS